MQPSIFREYDIRGIVGTEWVVEDAYDVARGIFSYLIYHQPALQRVVVGADGRVHSPTIKELVIKAAHDLGLDVLDIGLCPTPLMYFALHTTDTTSGVIITASHNPGNYNGIKICAEKKSIWGTQIQQIRALIEERRFYTPVLKRLPVTKLYDIQSAYITMIKQKFAHLVGLPLRAIIDCGNGAAGAIMPRLVHVMGWDNVELIYADVDGTFPNHEADPTVKKNMTDLITKITASAQPTIGIGFDGDADRMGAFDEQGELLPGDQLLALFAQHVEKGEEHTAVVCDIKCSQGLVEVMRDLGVDLQMVASGHSIIKAAMATHHAVLGGELSCHFFFADRYFGYDDGIYAALRLIEIITQTGKALHELMTFFPRKVATAEIRIPCEESQKKEVVGAVREFFAARADVHVITVDGVRAHMPYGWGLLRASNTQSHFCLRFEADHVDGLRHVQQDFIGALAGLIDVTKLKEQLD